MLLLLLLLRQYLLVRLLLRLREGQLLGEGQLLREGQRLLREGQLQPLQLRLQMLLRHQQGRRRRRGPSASRSTTGSSEGAGAAAGRWQRCAVSGLGVGELSARGKQRVREERGGAWPHAGLEREDGRRERGQAQTREACRPRRSGSGGGSCWGGGSAR